MKTKITLTDSPSVGLAADIDKIIKQERLLNALKPQSTSKNEQ